MQYSERERLERLRVEQHRKAHEMMTRARVAATATAAPLPPLSSSTSSARRVGVEMDVPPGGGASAGALAPGTSPRAAPSPGPPPLHSASTPSPGPSPGWPDAGVSDIHGPELRVRVYQGAQPEEGGAHVGDATIRVGATTVGELRRSLRATHGLHAEFTLRKRRVPIHASQDRLLASDFFKSANDVVVIGQ